MRFVLKAIFFLAVVAAFIPRQLDAEAGVPTPQAAELERASEIAAQALASRSQQDTAGAFCAQRPALCDTARESAAAARLVGGVAVSQARRALAESAAQPAPETVAAPAQ